jgi:hypothetical protein
MLKGVFFSAVFAVAFCVPAKAQTVDVDDVLDAYAAKMTAEGRRDFGELILASVRYNRPIGRIDRSLHFEYIVKGMTKGPEAKSRLTAFQQLLWRDYCESRIKIMEFARTQKISVYYMPGLFDDLIPRKPS